MSKLAGLCDRCEGVLPARSSEEFTLQRVELILNNGYCGCLPVAGDLSYLDAGTREMYLEAAREMDDTDPKIPIEDIGKAVARVEGEVLAAVSTPPPLVGEQPPTSETTIDGIVVERGQFEVIAGAEPDTQNGIYEAYVIGPDGTDPFGLPAIGARTPELWDKAPVPEGELPPGPRGPQAPLEVRDEIQRLPRIGPRGVEPEPVLKPVRQQPRRKARKRRR